MAFNPSPEVAAARDAAKSLGADCAIVYFVRPNGQCGYASYGKTQGLCKQTRIAADECWDDVVEALARRCQ